VEAVVWRYTAVLTTNVSTGRNTAGPVAQLEAKEQGGKKEKIVVGDRQ
jgi:hypothetical protein